MIYAGVTSFALGILLENFINFGFSLGLLFIFVSVITSLTLWNENKRHAQIILLVGCMFGLGLFRMSFVDSSPDPTLLASLRTQVEFEAFISSEPDIRDTNVRYTVTPIATDKSKIILVAERFPLFRYGDKIKVVGKLDLPKNFLSENGVEFDYVSYLLKDQIHFIIYRPEIIILINQEKSLLDKIFYSFYSFKYDLIHNIERVMPEPNSSLLAGMVLGVKQSLGENLLDQFKNVGLIHIVVLSGQNITLIITGIFLITSYIFRRNVSLLFSASFIILFGFMVGFTATVLRASIMALIALLARYLGRPQLALRWLFIAGFLMIVWNPLSLIYDPSFQLSFMATLGLVVFTPLVSNYLQFIPIKFGLREIVASTLAVQFFILPLLIKMSGQVSIISFLINPIVLPLVMPLMILGFLISLIGLIPFFGFLITWPLGAVSTFLTEFIIFSVNFSFSLPFATFSISSLSNLVIILWYIFYAFLCYRLYKVEFHKLSLN